MGRQKDQEQVIKILYGVPIVRSRDIAGRGARNSIVNLQMLKILLGQQRLIKEEGKDITFDLDTSRAEIFARDIRETYEWCRYLFLGFFR